MRLAVRLSIGVAALLLASGTSIGAFTASIARAEGIGAIDDRLDALVAVVAGAGDPVAALFDATDRSASQTMAWLYYDDSDAVAIVEPTGVRADLGSAEIATVDAATRSARTAGGGLRVRSLALGDGEWLVVAESRAATDEQYARAIRTSLAAAILVALAAALVAWLLVRRVLAPVRRTTEAATRIASGNLGTPLPTGGAAEIGELSAALSNMVASLREASTSHERAERRMRDFLGDASHELRTPLTVISGYVDILSGERPVDDEQRRRALSRLRSETSRMDGLIRDLLMMVEMDAIEVSRDDLVDLGEMAAEFFGDVADQQPSRRVTLACDSVTLQASRPHLSRLLANLSSNIVRHTDATVDVSVSVIREVSDAVLTVDDAGPGLSSSLYERASTGFDRFDRSRSPGAGGFGLGLRMVDAVVRLHGGSLSVSRSPMGGLRTCVRIPIAP